MNNQKTNMTSKTLGFLGITLICTVAAVTQTPPSTITDETIKADMLLHVCKNSDRLAAVKNLFKSKGAKEEEMKVENADNVENLIVTVTGKSEETIVIGAHYDKVSEGCGAIDNWTGLVVVANLYAAARKATPAKTLVFAAFGKEEQGLIGSAAMAKSIPKEKRTEVCSMLNFDSFGFTYPQVLTNSSNSRMTKFAEELAAEVKMPFSKASLAGAADADSTSFNAKDIPAITFHGLSGKWQEYLHSSKDKLENVNQQSVRVGYNFVSLYLSRVDASPCNIFRKKG